MLRIIEGGFTSVAYSDLKREILSLVEKGERVFMLVPEQQSVTSEKEMIEYLPSYAPKTFEVTNFTRLANTVYRSLGGISDEYSSPIKESLIMWKSLSVLFEDLSVFSESGSVSFGLVEKCLSALNEMKACGIKPDELLAASESDKIKDNRRLSNKLSDLSKITSLYERILGERYSSLRDECERLETKLLDNPEFFRGAYFYISGFTSFTEPQYRVISCLMRTSSVTVHLTLPKLDADSFEYSELKRTEAQLLRYADKNSVRKEILKRDGRLEDREPIFDGIAHYLFKSQGVLEDAELDSAKDSVKIYEAKTPYEACEFIASDILKKVMSGESFRDFAVIARECDGYDGIIDTVLTSNNIPCFFSKTGSISSHDAVRAILNAVRTVRCGFKREDLISYLKCGYSAISRETCDEFEEYLNMWQISGQELRSQAPFTMSTVGYSARRPKNMAEHISAINEVRKAATEPLLKLEADFNHSKTVRDFAIAVVKFISDIRLEDGLSNKLNSLSAFSESELFTSTERILNIIYSALDELVETLSNTEVSLTEFESLLTVLFSSVKTGRIPSNYDEVTIGSADVLRLESRKHIYLLGVNLGEFPKSLSDSSYFSVKDKELFPEIGLKEMPSAEISYAKELFFFARAFTLAKSSVTLLYSERGSDFSKKEPSEVIGRIKSITKERVLPIKISSLPKEEILYTKSSAIDNLSIKAVEDALRICGFSDDAEISKKPITNDSLRIGASTLKKLYPNSLPLTQTRIDTYAGCPFSYFLRYNLKLREDEIAEFDARNIGTFIHAILENFFVEMKRKNLNADSISEGETEALVRDSAKKFLSTLTEASGTNQRRTELLLERLISFSMPIVSGLLDELSGSGFTPEFFELQIGGASEEKPSALPFKTKGGKDVFLYGSIDRVDTYKKDGNVYVRVIDYKTGSKSFSPSDLDEGKNLQMFLYLKAVTESESLPFRKKLGVDEGGRIIPAGVIYVKTNMNDIRIPRFDEELAKRELKQNQERCGMLLEDEDSLGAMNKNYLPIKFKSDGTVDARSQNRLYSYGGWDELNRKISAKVEEISSEIENGNIETAKNEKDSPCDYCGFKAVCRKRF